MKSISFMVWAFSFLSKKYLAKPMSKTFLLYFLLEVLCLSFTSRFMIHFKLLFCIWYNIMVKVLLLLKWMPKFQASYVENIISLFNYLWHLVTNRLLCVGLLLDSVLFHWSIWLSLYKYYAILVIVDSFIVSLKLAWFLQLCSSFSRLFWLY